MIEIIERTMSWGWRRPNGSRELGYFSEDDAYDAMLEEAVYALKLVAPLEPQQKEAVRKSLLAAGWAVFYYKAPQKISTRQADGI